MFRFFEQEDQFSRIEKKFLNLKKVKYLRQHKFILKETNKLIEGFSKPGARVVIVDDVCTTGGSTINALEAAREAGMVIAAVVCIVERQEANGRPAVEAAAAGAPFLALFTATDVRAQHIRQQ